MKIVSAQEMQGIDTQAIEKLKIPSIVLMENAGYGVLQVIEKEYFPPRGRSITIFSGPGNNGGDGMVVARHLFNRGARVRVLLLTEKAKIRGDAAINLEIILNMGIPLEQLLSPRHVRNLKQKLASQDLLIDALLGTGSKGAPRGLIRETVHLINELKIPTLSVDLPTGVDTDTGQVEGEAVQADCTVTFAHPKRGFYLYPGMDYTGRIVVVDIGIPKDLGVEEIKCHLITSKDFPKQLFYRKPSSHKGSFGHVLVLAGSEGMTGAASLAALASLRMGAGLVTLGIPRSLNQILEIKLTEVMTLPLDETPEKTLSLEAFGKIRELAQKSRAVAVGPGISTNNSTKELVKRLVAELEVPMILDADGISAFAADISLLRERRAPLIITPHPGEMGQLLEVPTDRIQIDRLGAATTLAKETGKVVVLKGARTIISDAKGEVWINPTGNPGMASAGTGDVLTGIIGGLLAQEIPPFSSARTGVYLHGLAGDIAAANGEELTLVALDIIKCLPEAIRRVRSEYS